jgi:hypothetical protein|tara:strand:- start:378 stop:602 length:225 start_codon:yes stop_codon:yes gene_type:complete
MSELATSKQLWTINKLSSELGKEFSLPLTKDEASLIIGPLKIEEKNSFSKSLDNLAELQKKTTQEEYWAKTRKN